MGKHVLEEIVHEMKMIIVRMTDKQLVKAYEQSALIDRGMIEGNVGTDFVYNCIQQELAERHPRRWARFVKSGESSSMLRTFYIKG